MSRRLSHVNARGEARMVDVAAKPATRRQARAAATLRMQPATLALILHNGLPKGDVLATARLAGIMAAKRTPELIPLCHPLPLSSVSVEFTPDAGSGLLHIEACCAVSGQTGVEMEALSAAAVAALTVYDMCKAVERGMVIENLRLLEKQGGRSGRWRAPEAAAPRRRQRAP
jgi:cyclic pyranopterin phosphate synthase